MTSKKAYIFIAILAVASLLASYSLWEPLELRAYDVRFKAINALGLGFGKPTGNVIVVGIEEADINKKPLLFWYPDIGLFLLRMRDYGAKAVCLDIIAVHSLGDKLNSSIRSVAGDDLTPQNTDFLNMVGERADNSLFAPIRQISESVPVVQAVGGGMAPYYYPYVAHMKNVIPASATFTLDTDAVLRSQRLSDKDNMDSVAYATYKLLGGQQVQDERIMLNYFIGRHIPYYPLRNVLSGSTDKDIFRDKSVLLGFVSKSGDDVHRTPLGKGVSGVNIHATAIETLLTGTSPKAVSNALSITGMLVLTIIGLFVSAKLKPLHATAGVFLLSAIYGFLNLVFFEKGLVLPLFPHLMAPLLIFSFVGSFEFHVGSTI